SDAPRFVGVQGNSVYALVDATYGTATTLAVVPHPALGGATNTPPTAGIAVSPARGTTLTDFRFDASVTTDAEDPVSALRFRWDFDNDGQWDTPLSNNPVVTRRFALAGTKFVRMQVLDTLALADSTTVVLDVAFEPDPGGPGPSHAAFELPFRVTDAAF